MNMGESNDPGRRLVGTATSGLVQAEGLERSGEREEEDGRSEEGAKVEVGEPDSFEPGCWS